MYVPKLPVNYKVQFLISNFFFEEIDLFDSGEITKFVAFPFMKLLICTQNYNCEGISDGINVEKLYGFDLVYLAVYSQA